MMGSRQGGFSYTEVLVATALIALALVPMLDALQPAIQGAQIHAERAETHYVLKGKMEDVLANPFHDLHAESLVAGSPTTPTVYSDAGATIPHEVFIWRWDADNADGDDDGLTGVEEDLLWIRVATADGQIDLQTLVARP